MDQSFINKLFWEPNLLVPDKKPVGPVRLARAQHSVLRLILNEGAGNTVRDLSKWGHECVLTDTNWIAQDGGIALDFNGTSSEIVIPDSDSFSFIDGSNDKPFSVVAAITMRDATRFRILNKMDGTPGGSTTDAEWIFTLDGSDQLRFIVANPDITARLDVYSAPLTSYEGQRITVGATYDGSATHAGMKLYLNGAPLSKSTYSAGSYTHMTNGVSDVRIGSQFNFTLWADGIVHWVELCDRELSAAEMARWHHYPFEDLAPAANAPVYFPATATAGPTNTPTKFYYDFLLGASR